MGIGLVVKAEVDVTARLVATMRRKGAATTCTDMPDGQGRGFVEASMYGGNGCSDVINGLLGAPGVTGVDAFPTWILGQLNGIEKSTPIGLSDAHRAKGFGRLTQLSFYLFATQALERVWCQSGDFKFRSFTPSIVMRCGPGRYVDFSLRCLV